MPSKQIERKMRKNYLDAAAGFLIIQIIIGHILQLCYKWDYMDLWIRIFCFYMPFWYFKSGMFAKTNMDYKNCIRKGYEKLIVPFLAVTVIGWLMNMPFDFLNSDKSIFEIVFRPWASLLYHGSMPSSLTLWFLLSLFWVKILGQYVINTIPRSYTHIVALFVLLLGFGISFIYKYFPLQIATIFPGLFFYLMGYLSKDRIERLNIPSIVAFMLIFILICVFYDSVVEMRSNSLAKGNYFLWAVKNYMGLMVFLTILSKMPRLRLLEYIGQNSMSYYIFHWLVLLFIRNIFKIIYPGYTPELFISISVLCCFIILPLVNYFANKSFPYLIGNSHGRK